MKIDSVVPSHPPSDFNVGKTAHVERQDNFDSIINHKHILRKYYNHQEQTNCYLGNYKNTILEQ